jgi:hypothetical protein
VTRLRQIAFAAHDLDTATEQIRTTLGLEVAYRDPSVAMFGLANAIFPLGDSDFLEIVSPIQPDTAAGRYLDRRGGDSGYMLIFECDDIGAARDAVERLGIRIVQAFEGAEHQSLHLHPRDCGGIMLSLDSTTGDWAAAGPEWREYVRTTVTTGLRAIEVAVTAPQEILDTWAALTGGSVGAGVLRLDNADVHLRQATDEAEVGLTGLEVWRAPGAAVTAGSVCGVHIEFSDPADGRR